VLRCPRTYSGRSPRRQDGRCAPSGFHGRPRMGRAGGVFRLEVNGGAGRAFPVRPPAVRAVTRDAGRQTGRGPPARSKSGGWPARAPVRGCRRLAGARAVRQLAVAQRPGHCRGRPRFRSSREAGAPGPGSPTAADLVLQLSPADRDAGGGRAPSGGGLAAQWGWRAGR